MKIPKPPVVCKTGEVETYIAPPPPAKGRIIGLDCHPDTFTAAVFRSSTPHDAVKMSSHPDMRYEKMLAWATKEFTRADLFLMEAGTNSFEVCRRLQSLGLRAVVMESAHVGKHAKTYADNDKMAAARIALVYLAGNAPCVWQPDETTRQRRELLHAYRKVVSDHTAAVNTLRSFLSQWAIRLGSRNPELEKTHEWILSERDWSLLQRDLLTDYFANLRYQGERRKSHFRLIARQVGGDSLMLRCMKLLGIGMVNAFVFAGEGDGADVGTGCTGFAVTRETSGFPPGSRPATNGASDEYRPPIPCRRVRIGLFQSPGTPPEFRACRSAVGK